MPLYNRVMFQATSTGTGAFTIGAALTGFGVPADRGISDGTVIRYTAESADRTQWEVGLATYSTAGPTVNRNTIRNSSNSDLIVTFNSAPTVWLDYHAQDVALGTTASILYNSSDTIAAMPYTKYNASNNALLFEDQNDTSIKYYLYSNSISGDDRLIVSSSGTPFGTRIWFDSDTGGPAFSLAESGAEKFAFGNSEAGIYAITLYSVNFAFFSGDLAQYLWTFKNQAGPDLRTQSDGLFSWSNSATTSGNNSDLAIAKNVAKVLEINTGTRGDFAGTYIKYGGQSRVSSDFSKTSNTTLSNVTGLSVDVADGRTYHFRAQLSYTCAAAGGVQAAISGTATATAIIYDGWIVDSGANGIKGNTQATALGTAVATATTTGTAGHIEIRGTITVNVGGTLTVQFAQNTSNGTASTVKTGSVFIVDDLT